MDRVTKRIQPDVVLYAGKHKQYETSDIPTEVNSAGVREILQSIAAYEDTGLEPEEIKKMQGEMVTCYDESGIPYSVEAEGSEAKHIIDLLAAEAQGRLVVLPCKIGDMVYMPVGRYGITNFEEDKCDGFHIARDGILQIKAQCYSGNHGTYGIPGKTVFLTREEAEAALKGRGGDES